MLFSVNRFILVSSLLLLQACSSFVILDKAIGDIRYDSFYGAEAAFNDNQGNLYICIVGNLEGKRTSYWLKVPAKKLSQQSIEIKEFRGHKQFINYDDADLTYAWWILSRDNIVEGECDRYLYEDVSNVEIAHLITKKGSLSKTSRVNTHFLNTSKLELVYDITPPLEETNIQDSTLYYANQSLNFGDGYAMKFSVEHYNKGGSPLWYLLLPPAIALDILLSPVLIPMWFIYADAH